jgi:hypothetical protein
MGADATWLQWVVYKKKKGRANVSRDSEFLKSMYLMNIHLTKWVKNLHRHFSKEGLQMATDMKNIQLIIKEVHIKTFYFSGSLISSIRSFIW